MQCCGKLIMPHWPQPTAAARAAAGASEPTATWGHRPHLGVEGEEGSDDVGVSLAPPASTAAAHSRRPPAPSAAPSAAPAAGCGDPPTYACCTDSPRAQTPPVRERRLPPSAYADSAGAAGDAGSAGAAGDAGATGAAGFAGFFFLPGYGYG